MTNSHPSNVKTCCENILASGTDSLVLALDVVWNDASIFSYLDEIKEKAKKDGIDHLGQLKHYYKAEIWPCWVKPHGSKGYSWILEGRDFTFKIGNWTDPGPRPSVMVEIRSETLWGLGPEEAIKIVLGIVEANGGHIVEAKLSRVDFCIDYSLPEEIWSIDLIENHAVMRATNYETHIKHRKLTGFSIGKGVIIARIYDKPVEIKQKLGKKSWMFNIWKIEEVPTGKKIIRFEFQIRRERLKELGMNSAEDLFQKGPNLWAYCTKKWLKFHDHPELHHTQQKTLDWWAEIQDGFLGVQGAEPLVRVKAISNDKRQLLQQAKGYLTSLEAIGREERRVDQNKPVGMGDLIKTFIEEDQKQPGKPYDVKARVNKKRPKYHQESSRTKGNDALYLLGKLGDLS